MGLDFLDKTAKPFHRSCQKGFESLRSVYLFDPAVSPTERLFLARLDAAMDLPGEKEVVLRVEGDGITLYSNEREFAHCHEPPIPIMEKIRGSGGGLAIGRLETVHPLSRSVDVVVL